MERMGIQPILPVKLSITIDTMLNFDSDGHGDCDVTCKQTLILLVSPFLGKISPIDHNH